MMHWVSILILMPILMLLFFLKKNSKWCIGVVYGAAFFAFAPAITAKFGGWSCIVEVFIYPLRLFTAGIEYDKFLDLIKSYGGGKEVLITCTVIYALAPLCTVAVILNYIKKVFDILYIMCSFGRDIFVFSEFNENTLYFAAKLKERYKNASIIFAETDKHPEYDMYRFMSFPIQKIYKYIPPTASAHVVFANKDENVSLGKFFEFSDMEHKRKAEVYIYSTKKDVEHITDCIKKKENKLCIRLINTEELLVLDTLWKHPLFMNMRQKKEFNISVFGVGNMGSSFIKEALWCTSLDGYSVKFNLVDNGDAVKNLVMKCPYINPEEYDINPVRADVLCEKTEDIIKKPGISGSNYIFVSLGDDALNTEIASKLRLEFNRKNKHPAIVAVIEDENKRKISEKLLLEENIFVTGDISLFCDVKYMDEHPVFRYGYEVFRCVQDKYGLDPSADAFYNQLQTELMSSLSNAVHMIYKVFAVMGKDFLITNDGEVKTVFDENEKNALRKAFENADNVRTVSVAEHKRWMIFEKLKGYMGIEEKTARESFLERRFREELSKQVFAMSKKHNERKAYIEDCGEAIKRSINPFRNAYLEKEALIRELDSEQTNCDMKELLALWAEGVNDGNVDKINDIVFRITEREKAVGKKLEENLAKMKKGIGSYFERKILEMKLELFGEMKMPPRGKIHKEIEKKINLAIVEYESLSEIDEQIAVYERKNPKLEELDEVLTRKIPEIFGGVENV